MEPFDRGALAQQCGDDEALADEVLEVFRGVWRVQLADVQAAVARADWPASKAAAHRLKGALLTIAAVPSSTLAHDVELAALAGDGDAVRAGVAALEAELARLAAALG